MRYFWLAIFGAVLCVHAETMFQSGPQRVSLLELYTSEGCSSCPPAEAWLERLKSSPRLWNTLVPVAFHVDYWDDLGWKDRFAKPEYTSRQRAYSLVWGSSSVYTPGFVLDGQEWKGWFSGNPLPDPGEQVAGRLGLKISANRASIEYSGAPGLKEVDAYLVPLEMNISSEVLAGENRGRHLAHSFVALALVSQRLSHHNGKFEIELPFDYPGAKAVAVWVTPAGSAQPIQAAGGYLK
jgi:hypothetical protein